jgi:MFS family permease
MVVFIQFPLTRWLARFPLLPVMIGGSALYLIGYGSYGWLPSVPVFILGMIFATGGEMLVVPTNQAMVALLAPDDMRARYVAAGRLSWIIAQSLGPIAGGAIMDHYDANWVWALSAVFCALSIAGYYGMYLYAGKQLNAKQEASIPPSIRRAPAPKGAQ